VAVEAAGHSGVGVLACPAPKRSGCLKGGLAAVKGVRPVAARANRVSGPGWLEPPRRPFGASLRKPTFCQG